MWDLKQKSKRLVARSATRCQNAEGTTSEEMHTKKGLLIDDT